jgi:hypothetical protein
MSEWTVNNKLNEWYQKRYHIKLPKQYETKSRIFFSTGTPLEDFALWAWFLKSGVWNLDGQWVDDVAWTPNWFLTTGIINVYGAWADSEAWA